MATRKQRRVLVAGKEITVVSRPRTTCGNLIGFRVTLIDEFGETTVDKFHVNRETAENLVLAKYIEKFAQ